MHAITALPCRGAFCTCLLTDYSAHVSVLSGNAFKLRRDSCHCGQCRGLGAAAPRLMCLHIRKIGTWDQKGNPQKVGDRFYVFLPCMRPASFGAPAGFIAVTGLLGHHAVWAAGDGSLRSVGNRGSSTRPPVHAGANSPGLPCRQDVP